MALANREVGRYFGVSTDVAKAVELYRIASERGDADALFEVGAAFADGKGVERDEEKAVALWQQAAAKSEVRAVFNLGVAYEQGRGVPRDEAAALRHYRVGSELGHAPSTHNLAVMHMEGIGGLSKDESRAVELYERAASLGHAAAAYTAGVMHEHGRGVPQDFERAMKFYKRAAAKGYAAAMVNLGCMFTNGQGVAQDLMCARELFSEALALGDSRGASLLEQIQRGLNQQMAAEKGRLTIWDPAERKRREGKGGGGKKRGARGRKAAHVGLGGVLGHRRPIAPDDCPRALPSGLFRHAGVAKDGRPILLVKAALWRPSEYGVEEYSTYIHYMVSTSIARMGENVSTHLVLFDMSDYSMVNSSFPMLKELININETFYSEALRCKLTITIIPPAKIVTALPSPLPRPHRI